MKYFACLTIYLTRLYLSNPKCAFALFHGGEDSYKTNVVSSQHVLNKNFSQYELTLSEAKKKEGFLESAKNGEVWICAVHQIPGTGIQNEIDIRLVNLCSYFVQKFCLF